MTGALVALGGPVGVAAAGAACCCARRLEMEDELDAARDGRAVFVEPGRISHRPAAAMAARSSSGATLCVIAVDVAVRSVLESPPRPQRRRPTGQGRASGGYSGCRCWRTVGGSRRASAAGVVSDAPASAARAASASAGRSRERETTGAAREDQAARG